ncbi:MAG: transglutaminase domain-containing protein [Bacteroidales bacterium]|jgi:transglutaminase-like putative cysteine protease|nr:transglutaminase domain-containing protein [Bacteroidales bacterium]
MKIFRKLINVAIVTATTMILICCSSHETRLRATIEQDLTEKLDLLDYRPDFEAVLDLCENDQERDAIKFLYAYMPLGDIADYDSQLFVEGVRSAFKAREEMTWGNNVPDDLFRHYVLPLRVNNENLDSARTVFYRELKPRVEGLSMYDAVLEVNHWCHEKVTYTPSDARTSAPLASVRTAYGRCGEESTFTVTALRAVGIPARQVYTPRWAHTDNNHAWVEAWVEGQWHYLGACEPEARLDVAWFSSTALRALLMHNRSFGRYSGSEDVIQHTDCFTEINVTANYTETERLTVCVKDISGAAVQGALVEFKIYNYAEFYSAIKVLSDARGYASAILGKGDVLVWASKDGAYGYAKARAREEGGQVTIVLEHKPGDVFQDEIDIVPPVEGEVPVVISPEEKAANDLRLAYEDSLRNSYVATFVKPLANDPENDFLVASRGNWREISSYLEQIKSGSKSRYRDGMRLLSLISEKDLRDTPASVLLDHLNNFCGVEGMYPQQREIWYNYVLNPRIGNELLKSWRGEFQTLDLSLSLTSGSEIAGYVRDNIKVLDRYNPQRIPISPLGVHSLRAADALSRDWYFVALCRALNIPARIEEISGKVQYYDSGYWIDAAAELSSENTEVSAVQNPTGLLMLTDSDLDNINDPKFESHFTIASLEEGRINTLNFRDREGNEGTMSVRNVFKEPVELDCGSYLLTTGTRMASGKVLAGLQFFNIEEGSTNTIDLRLREDDNDLQVLGSFYADPLLPLTGRGMYILAFVRPSHEPSDHIIRTLFAHEWSIPVILFFGSEAEMSRLNLELFPQIPHKVSVATDNNNTLSAICDAMKLDPNNLKMPLVVIADSFGSIFLTYDGYSTTLLDQLIKAER